MKLYILSEYDVPFTALDDVLGEVIMCKDCKHWFQGSCFIDSFSEYDDFNYEREGTDFCSRAERRTDEIN